MSDPQNRTPEKVLWTALRDLATERTAAQAGYGRQTDTIIQALAQAGYRIVPAEGSYTRDQVNGALNDAANTLSEHDHESSDTIAADSAVDLLVNTAMYLLDHPDGSLDDAIAAQYADSFDIRDLEDELDDGEDVPEPGTERWNQLVAAKVKGWVS